jgi:thiol:disulfide interchange protein DsbD
LFLVAGYVGALEGALDWRHRTPPSGVSTASRPDEIDWQPWSPAAVERARAEGRPVLVDFTARWCPNCRVNKKTSIDIPSVRQKLKEISAVPLRGDYTHFPDDITAELKRFQRAGVPLNLVYPKGPSRPPIVLPEILTPSIVLEALDKAAGSATDSTARSDATRAESAQ